MDEDYGMEFDEGSDIDNWETEQVFQDHEGREDEDDLADEDEESASWEFDPERDEDYEAM